MSITKLDFDIRRKVAGLHERASGCPSDVYCMIQYQEEYVDCHPYITRLLYQIFLRRHDNGGTFRRIVLMIVMRCPSLDKAETT